MKIRLNSLEIDLSPNCKLEALKKENSGAKWWLDIILFLEEWANDSSILTIKTSGSTGVPKEIVVKKAGMWVSATKTCDFFQLNETSTGLLCLSAHYIAGKMMLVRALVSGMNLLCIKPTDNPVQTLNEVIDFTAMVPMQAKQSLKNITQFNHIKNLIIGGGQVPRTLISELKQSSTRVFETFGMTETLSHIALKQLTPEYQNYFTPLNGVYILQGFQKRLVIDFPELGIYKMKTNDIIELVNNSGAFIWKGRSDFIINSGGIKISPEEVEEKIAHLFSQKFFIKGMPDEKLGEKLVLFIEGERFNTSKLNLAIQQSLPSYHSPKEIRFLEKLPLTDSGKIRRKEVF